jgi:hypothetical protein
LFESLPFDLGDSIVSSGFVSVFHNKHGPAYLLATPKEINLFVDNPELAEILGKRKDLIKPDESGEPLNFVWNQCRDSQWRGLGASSRITTPSFNKAQIATMSGRSSWPRLLGVSLVRCLHHLSSRLRRRRKLTFVKCCNFGHPRERTESPRPPVTL